jgi:chorismate mutase-like protein
LVERISFRRGKPSLRAETAAALENIGYLRCMAALPAEVVASRVVIDEIDHAIVELLARRRRVVADLFAKKRALGLPLFDAERESVLLEERRAFAERAGVPSRLVEGVFRKVLEDSHHFDAAD